jgi:hypothetical protein
MEGVAALACYRAQAKAKAAQGQSADARNATKDVMEGPSLLIINRRPPTELHAIVKTRTYA